MSTSAMSRAMARGIRRSMKHQTGDLSGLRKLRNEIQQTDQIAEAWNGVGQAMKSAMSTMESHPRTNPGRTSRTD